MSKLIATFFGVGLLKPAPGTWGSLAALPLFWITYEITGLIGILTVSAAAFYFGWKATEVYSQQRQSHDASEVVIDEVVGQFIALLPVGIIAIIMGVSIERLWPGWILAFVLFRAFDIFKPGIIGRFDKSTTALSVMLDDVFAGLYAAIGVLILLGAFLGIG